jgi:2'-deoxynucleoside 5'-phosphate N-hydrolase
MKALMSIKFHSDGSNVNLMKEIALVAKKVNVELKTIFVDYEKEGENKFSLNELMLMTFEAIKNNDCLIVELSEKGVGLGIEAGYAFSKNKPVYVIAKKGSDISDTLSGISKEIFFYETVVDLEEFFSKIRI